MALQDPQAEPSMEEILASIRRIISEEEQAPEPVLDLVETEEEEEAEAAPPAAPSAETILAPPTASAAAGALARLAGSLRIADTPGQTIEGVVRELLKPMLKEWLDQNLAQIVESRVEAELERIARMSR